MAYEIDLRPACIAGPIQQIKDVLKSVAREDTPDLQTNMVAESFYKAARHLQLATGAQDFSMTLKVPDGRAVEMRFIA